MTAISEDFAVYLAANWASVTGNTVPDIIKVMNFDRERRIQGFSGTYTNGVVLVHRGSFTLEPLDYGYSKHQWASAVMLHGLNSTQTQQLVLDIVSIINDWESSGGGAFDTGGLVMNSFFNSGFDFTMEKTAVGALVFYSKQIARS